MICILFSVSTVLLLQWIHAHIGTNIHLRPYDEEYRPRCSDSAIVRICPRQDIVLAALKLSEPLRLNEESHEGPTHLHRGGPERACGSVTELLVLPAGNLVHDPAPTSLVRPMLRIGQHACRVASRRYSRSVRPVDPVGVRTLTLTGATSPKTTTTTTTTTTRVCSWRGTKSQPPSSLWTIQTCRYSQPPSPRQPADSPPGAAGRSSDAAPPTSHNHASVVAAQQQFQRLQRAVTDLNLGDQVSVILISVLTVLILASPYWLSHIRRLDQDDYDDLWASSDVIDDLTKLARTEWGREDEVTDDEERHGKGSNALETILRDVMQSQTLQVAAQQFVVAVVSSEPVKAALQRLLAELFRDLIQDKETLAQVIQLLNKVIQDDSIKQAAQALVLDLVAEPDVKEALVGLLQQVAREEPVPTTIIELLKHSAHATLNDTDVLDHR